MENSKMEGSVISEGSASEASLDIAREEKEKLLKVLSGNLENLPALGSRIVRIFTSSTFTDTTLERNALMENVYPRLKEELRETYGLEFQVVDMRWGVRDEATDDHMTTHLCMKEIENCQRLSVGPNFVVFLGQKYGYRPLPTHILATEFEMLRECVKNTPGELDLLDTWYKKDENAVPAVYALQPISSILKHFNSKRIKHRHEEDQAAWWETFTKLQRIVRKAAQVLFITKKIDREEMHNYFMSVTEREVEKGILKANDINDHCLAYIRDINNINITPQVLRFASKFVDFAARNVDGEAQKLLKALRDDKLSKKMPDGNIVRFEVEWGGKEGIDKETHADYLQQFCEHFHSNIIRLVDSSMAKFEKLSSDPAYSETLQHLHACQSFCSVFQGREDIVEKIHQYLDNEVNQPLILHGESGCGKTSLMAKGVNEVCKWLLPKQSPMLILRFLGTTPNSSSITPLLTSLCRQLSILYDQPLEDIPDELAPLIQHFKKLLTSATSEMPIVMFLDSLDQLSGADGAHQLAWLPAVLPRHVKLVLSTLPNYYNLLDTLKNMIDLEDNFVQVLPLGENLSGTILKFWLKNDQRTLTDSQWELVNEAFTKCNLPLFVKLVFDEVCGWKSYTKASYTTLAYTIHDSIMNLFEKIEMQHGKTLVAHALGYITAAKSGLSEAELEDMLSLDEKVLNDVYQYHLPPVRRIPPLLWTRIRNDLPGYLSEREADGVNVIAWYHRQFINAATERYFKNLNFLSNVHSNIADYFIGVWGGGNPKPFEYTDQQRRMFHLEEKGGECDRKVPQQPLVFQNADGEVIRHNLRKLSELPYHLIRSHRYEELYSKCLFNFSWLHAKLSSMPLQTLLSDFEDLLDHVYQKDVKLIADAIRLSSSILSHYPDMLGPQIIGRLLPHYYQSTNIQSLIQQCDTDGLLQCALVPVHHCLHTPGGPLQYSLEGHLFAPFGISVTSNGKHLISVSNRLIIWDLTTGGVFRTIEPSSEGILQGLTLSDNDKHAVCYTTKSQVLVFSIMTGECLTITPPIPSKNVPIIGTTLSNTQVAAWTNIEWYLYTINGKFISKHDIELKMPIIHVEFGSDSRTYLTVRSGMDSDNEMTLEVEDQTFEPFEFHSAIALTTGKQKMYTCIEISDFAVVVYKKDNDGWHYDRTLGDNSNEVFALTLSKDENYLVATIATGYKLWNLKTDNLVELKLPSGTRNVPSRNQVTSPLVFTKQNHFVVAGVRKNLYVWDVKQGNMVKTLDAHFGRIIALTSVTVGGNTVISSSIDKTIKVWNFDNILEDVHSIDRLEKPIEDMQIASEAEVAVTTSRNCVGVWNLLTGKLQKTFGTSSIVTLAVTTKDASFVAAAETETIAIWDLKNEVLPITIAQKDVLQLLLNEDDTKLVALSKRDNIKGFCACYSLPNGEQVYKFEYGIMKTFKHAVITRDGSFLAVPAIDKSGDVLGVYHARNGSHLYNLQLKYNNYKELIRLVYMPHDSNQIAIVDEEKSNVIDLKKRTLLRSVNRWNGMCTRDGRTGLYAPNRGGLQLLDTKSGKTKMTMIPRVAEGVFSIDVTFTRNDQHVVYYHSGHRTIRVFRVKDGKRIANFKAHAEVKVIECTQDGSRVVIGAIDGSVTILAIADPAYAESVEFLQTLPSRLLQNMPKGSAFVSANGDLVQSKHSIGTTLQVARFVAKARGAQKSGACLVS